MASEGAVKGCRYCDSDDRTREHALAIQLAEVIPQPAEMTAERLRVVSNAEEKLSEWSTSTPASVVVRDFCNGCNGGWMNAMDTAIKGELAALCQGMALPLDEAAVLRWASWIVKQYFSYASAYPDDYSQPEDYRAFYDTSSPLSGMQVYLGLGGSLPWPHIHGQRPLFVSPMLSADPNERRVGLQLWTAAYGQLVIQVVHVRDARLRVPVRPDGGTIVRLWPDPPEEFDLTTLTRLDETAFAMLTKLRPLLQP